MPKAPADNANAPPGDDVFHLQQAFKLALSLVLFYWLALSLNWDLPKYGALAIVLVSLDTAGASIWKGMMRVIGTTVGVAVGFLVLGLFCHDRWATMLALAGYLTVVGYFIQQSQYKYAWFVSAFVPLTVWASTYPNFETAFYFGTFRWLETTVGVLVYTTVSTVVWPRGIGDQLATPVAMGVASQQAASESSGTTRRFQPLVWDVQRFLKALFIPATFIAAFLFWILANPPAGPLVVMFATVLALIQLQTPHNPIVLPAVLVLTVVFVIGPVYCLVMPSLSTGTELMALVFVFAMLFGYLGGKSPVLKMAPMVMFVTTTGISNDQQYSFTALITASMMLVLAAIVMAVVYVLFFAPRPEPSPVSSPG